jgi:hypothetical protein
MLMKHLALGWVLLACGVTAQAQITSPPNDHYTNRIVLTGTDISFSGTLAGATHEFDPFEVLPTFAPGSQTVWWSWTAPQSGTVVVQIFDSSPAYRPDGLAIWTLQSLNHGQVVGGRRIDSRLPHCLFTFQAQAGTNYDIQLVGGDSASFSFTLVETNVPCVIESPKSQTITVGDSVLFTVVAAGAGPFGYQWQFNGTNMPGETAPILQLDNVAAGQAGAYSAMVTNSAGTTLSDAGILTVTPVDIPPLLSAASGSNGSGLVLGVLGEMGRRYRIFASTNLHDWQAQAGFPTRFTNYSLLSQPIPVCVVVTESGTNHFAIEGAGKQKFFRATPFHALNEVCNNNLKAIRVAQLLFAYESGTSGLDSQDFARVRQYFKGQVVPPCPAGGFYAVTITLRDPACSVHSLEEP